MHGRLLPLLLASLRGWAAVISMCAVSTRDWRRLPGRARAHSSWLPTSNSYMQLSLPRTQGGESLQQAGESGHAGRAVRRSASACSSALLCQVLLVVLFCLVERRGRQDLGHDRPLEARLVPLNRGLCGGTLLIVEVEHGGPVLRAVPETESRQSAARVSRCCTGV